MTSLIQLSKYAVIIFSKTWSLSVDSLIVWLLRWRTNRTNMINSTCCRLWLLKSKTRQLYWWKSVYVISAHQLEYVILCSIRNTTKITKHNISHIIYSNVTQYLIIFSPNSKSWTGFSWLWISIYQRLFSIRKRVSAILGVYLRRW